MAKKISEILYDRYEYLAKKYASKIYSYEELSYEYEDLLQEFRMKIFTSIKAYGRRYNKYMKLGYAKPVPIKYYIEAACSNKARDFIKFIERENHKVRIDEVNYDFGCDNETDIKPDENLFIINGVNLLEGLTGKERAIFSLYLRGYNNAFLRKVYFNNSNEKKKKKEVIDNDDEPLDVTDIIEIQRNFLIKKYGNDLRQCNKVFESYNIED